MQKEEPALKTWNIVMFGRSFTADLTAQRGGFLVFYYSFKRVRERFPLDTFEIYDILNSNLNYRK